MVQQSDESERIVTPSSAAVSPNMDFNKIISVAVFPLFPGGGQQMQMYSPGIGMMEEMRSVEDPEFAEQVVQTFSSELIAKQSQWKIRSHKDTIDAIFKHDLGRGYKNFQADYNTAHGQMSAFVITGESKKFLRKLSAVMNVDAFIFGSYGLVYGTKMVQVPLLGLQKRQAVQCNVNVALFHCKDEAIWWRATDNKNSTDKTKLISSIAKSLASYVGKGTLQQL
jgi:hypothetical protein